MLSLNMPFLSAPVKCVNDCSDSIFLVPIEDEDQLLITFGWVDLQSFMPQVDSNNHDPRNSIIMNQFLKKNMAMILKTLRRPKL